MTRNQRLGVTFGIVALTCLLLYLLRGALVPIFIALFFAYLLDPVVDLMERHRLNRSTSIVILATVVLVVVGSVGTFVTIQTEREGADLVQNMPSYLHSAHERLNPLAIQYLGREIPFSFEEIFNEARTYLQDISPTALKPVTDIIASVSTSTWAFFTWLFGLVVIPVFLFYFLRDWHKMTARVAEMVPLSYRGYVLEKAHTINGVLSAFFRGQLTVAGILGLIYSVGLLSLGVNLAVVIGIGSGILFILPYVGTAIGVTSASIMVLLQYGLTWRLPACWAVFAVGQSLEAFVLTPRITGEKVGLSPVAVIFSLMIGAELLGFLGILIAVPVASVANVILRDLVERYRNSEYFLSRGGGGAKN